MSMLLFIVISTLVLKILYNTYLCLYYPKILIFDNRNKKRKENVSWNENYWWETTIKSIKSLSYYMNSVRISKLKYHINSSISKSYNLQ